MSDVLVYLAYMEKHICRQTFIRVDTVKIFELFIILLVCRLLALLQQQTLNTFFYALKEENFFYVFYSLYKFYLTSGSQLSFNAKLADVCNTERRREIKRKTLFLL